MPVQLDSPPTGCSRFDVLFCNPTGTKKQRKWVEGKLTVGFNSTVLFDPAVGRCVMCLKGTGLRPNSVYQKMERAHCGADWYAAGTELTVGSFSVQIEQVMHLHLIPLPMAEAVCEPVAMGVICTTGHKRYHSADLTDSGERPISERSLSQTNGGEDHVTDDSCCGQNMHDFAKRRSHTLIREQLHDCGPHGNE